MLRFKFDFAYIFDTHTAKLISTIKLSDRILTNEQNSNTAFWQLIHPATKLEHIFMIMMRNGRIKISIDNEKKPSKEYVKTSFKTEYYYSQLPNIVNQISFAQPKKEKCPYLVSLIQEKTMADESDNKETTAAEASSSLITSCWDIESGQSTDTISTEWDENFIATHTLSRSGRLITPLSPDVYSTMAYKSDGRPLVALNPSKEESSLHELNINTLISPSGWWVLSNRYAIRVKKEAHRGHILLPSIMCYLGGEHMKRITQEDRRIDRRKLMMRLYSLQQASACSEHTQPPLQLQEAIGMIKTKKHSNNNTPYKGTDCIIS